MSAAKEKVELTVNLGWQDADRLGLRDLATDELMEGCTVEVAEADAKAMCDRQWAKPVQKPKARQEAPPVTTSK